jgi:hypothetical protein
MLFFSEGFTFRNFLADAFAVFMFVLWFWLLIIVIGDLFRRHDISGWVKAIWVIALIVFPYLGIFAYLITQSRGMAERSSQQAQQAREECGVWWVSALPTRLRSLIGSRNQVPSPIRSSRAFAPSWLRREIPHEGGRSHDS